MQSISSYNKNEVFIGFRGNLEMVFKEKNPLILIALLVAGFVIGGILGDYLGGINGDFKILQDGFELGFKEPFNLDLQLLKLNFGFLLKVNIASALGIIAAIFVYKKI